LRFPVQRWIFIHKDRNFGQNTIYILAKANGAKILLFYPLAEATGNEFLKI
jgi:hypothetical protein